jgi:hypothetical protein
MAVLKFGDFCTVAKIRENTRLWQAKGLKSQSLI